MAFAIYANVNTDDEFAGKHVCRDASGEVEYYDTIDVAIACALDMQDECRSPNVHYTVEAR